MAVTIILSLILMTALFLMLYAAVALVQDKRLFTSAPKDIQAVILPHMCNMLSRKMIRKSL